MRAGYNFTAARGAPRVQLGDAVATDVFWTGGLSTAWARNWTDYWLPKAGRWAADVGGHG